MNKLCIALPPFAPDYSGACSALFELGGLIVIHDASGCTGNYTGYDEPRWYGSGSFVFCSSLRELDAVLGDDEKLVNKIIRAAGDLRPNFVAVLGSPVPMVIGADLTGVAVAIENRTGIPSFGFDTTGLAYYDHGAGQALLAFAKRFVKAPAAKRQKCVNLLGATPLDFHTNGNIPQLKKLLSAGGYTVGASVAMDCTFEELQNCAQASVNLVVATSGLPLAEHMKTTYGIPYVCGLPVGTRAPLLLLDRLAQAELCKAPEQTAPPVQDADVLVIHDQIIANGLRDCLRMDYGLDSVQVATPFHLHEAIAAPKDIRLRDEGHIRKVLNGGWRTIIADPLYAQLLRAGSASAFVPLPHVAISSKACWDDTALMIGEKIHAYLRPYGDVLQ